MSYQVLARKWRPRYFDEMVGQEHVLRALINALNEQRLHHAYLFTGTRGVGKTTIARILAKCLNCETGISARPCGECSACREIAEGRFVDLIEVDAASRTKVEDTRELLDNVQYAPTRGRFKVYLIDEVHMLSTHSFNALLKTLEEPPAHVKFLLATTDPQKLPVTVLSRCLQFSLKNMTPENIVGYLESVLKEEQVEYQPAALWQLGRAAQGSMRDALSLTDQAIAFGEGKVLEEQVTSMLGTMDRGRLFKLADIMARGQAAEIMREVADMAEHSPDYDEVVQGLLALWHKASVAQVLPDAIDNTQGDRQAILALAGAMAPEDLQLYYQVALAGRKDLALAPDPRQGFEMLMLRMLAFRPAPETLPDIDLVSALEVEKKNALAFHSSDQRAVQTAGPDSLDEVDEVGEVDEVDEVDEKPGEAQIHGVDASQNSVEEASAVLDAEAISSETIAQPVFEPTPHPDDAPPWHEDGDHVPFSTDDAGSVQNAPLHPEGEPQTASTAGFSDALKRLDGAAVPKGSAVEQSDPSAAPASKLDSHSAGVASSQSTAEAAADSALAQENGVEELAEPSDSASDLPELRPHTWWQWVERLTLGGLPLAIARNSALVSRDGDLCVFDIDPQQGALFNSSHQSKIQDALRLYLPELRIQMQLKDPSGETPEQRRQRLVAEAQYLAQQSIESDRQVRSILSDFNATLVADTIRPVE